MRKYKANVAEYDILLENGSNVVYPYLRAENGDKDIFCVSPNHGRSFIVGKNNDRFIISKGNGLSYTQHAFLNTREMGIDSWGVLLESDAVRDFQLGIEVASLGVKTNQMEYVLKMKKEFTLPDINLAPITPVLLQYSVESPYRINDAAYMTDQEIRSEISKWDKLNDKGFKEYYLIAANVLIQNLRILHNNNVLHNAIHEQNYTWALELLDFELACSPKHPYSSEDDMRHVKDLFDREIMQTYVIINHIACVLQEKIDYACVDTLFDEYGFDLEKYNVGVAIK